MVEGAAVVPVGPESLRLSHCGSSFTIPVCCPPPFWYEGKWCTVDDFVLNAFKLPGMPRLYRTWTRAVGSVGGLPRLGEDGEERSPGATLGFTG